MKAEPFNSEHLHLVHPANPALPNYTGSAVPELSRQIDSYGYRRGSDFIKHLSGGRKTEMPAQRDWEKTYLKKVSHAQD